LSIQSKKRKVTEKSNIKAGCTPGIFDVKFSITGKNKELISFDASFDVRKLKPV